MPMRGRYLDRPFAQPVRLQDVHKSIQRSVRVEHIVTIVNDGAEPRPDEPQVVPAVGLEKIAELLEKGFDGLERHFGRRFVSPRSIGIAPGLGQNVEQPQGLLQTLDELEHQLHVPATGANPQPFLPVREALALKDVRILVRIALLGSRPEFHGVFILRCPIAQSAPVVRMKICPSDTAGELSV